MAKVFKIVAGVIGAVALLGVLVWGGWYAYQSIPANNAAKGAAPSTLQNALDTANEKLATAEKKLSELLAEAEKKVGGFEPQTATPPPAPQQTAAVWGADAKEGGACTGRTTGRAGIWKVDPSNGLLGCHIGSKK